MTLTKASKHPFDSAEYWKEEAEKWKNLYESEREAHEDFRQSSKELEQELEHELAVHQETISSLKGEKTRLLSESQLRRLQAESTEIENRLRTERDRLKLECGEKAEKIRRLELANDDLERSDRIKAQQVLDMMVTYEECLERCGMLEAATINVPFDEDDNIIVPSSGSANAATLKESVSSPQLDQVKQHNTPRRLPCHVGTQTDDFWVKLDSFVSDSSETTYRRLSNGRPSSGAGSVTRSGLLVQELLHKIEDFEKRIGTPKKSTPMSSKSRKSGDIRYTPRH
ncbi:ER to Golgi transport-related protein [Aphelenchoides avenae]|nr:ER to Golgi transport-related protein [Aphelenchus avenae]